MCRTSKRVRKMRNMLVGVGLFGAIASSSQHLLAQEVAAISEEQMKRCMEQSVLTADKSMTVRNLQEACAILLSKTNSTDIQSTQTDETSADSTIIKGTDIQRSPRMLN